MQSKRWIVGPDPSLPQGLCPRWVVWYCHFRFVIGNVRLGVFGLLSFVFSFVGSMVLLCVRGLLYYGLCQNLVLN